MCKTEKFRFIRFEVEHSLSTLKVGQDAVLLGSFTKIEHPRNILDIGTGCGIIALMLAQRSSATIDAIDIDENSANEAGINFRTSCWSNRLNAFHTSLKEYSVKCTKKYDLIVSNPPFFQHDLLPGSKKLQVAKHATFLGFGQFISDASKLMEQTGKLVVILPTTEGKDFTKKCEAANLFLVSEIQIIPREGKKPNRLILSFSDIKTNSPAVTQFVVRDESGKYSQTYQHHTAQFHPPEYFAKPLPIQ